MKKTINFLIVLMLLIEASFASQIAPSIGDSEVLSSEELNLPIIYQDFGNNLYVNSASGYGESLRLELSDGSSILLDLSSKENPTGIITNTQGDQMNFFCQWQGESIDSSNPDCQFFQVGQGITTDWIFLA
jgi:hypothetical protein